MCSLANSASRACTMQGVRDLGRVGGGMELVEKNCHLNRPGVLGSWLVQV